MNRFIAIYEKIYQLNVLAYILPLKKNSPKNKCGEAHVVELF